MSNASRTQTAELQRLVAYHHWAGDQLFDAAAALTAADLDAPWGGSFKTGRGLMAHMLGAERIWSDRWQGAQITALTPYPASHAGKEFGAEWRRVRDDQRRFVDGLSAETVRREFTYKNLRGQVKAYSIADILLHVVNHGTYHRGQLAQLLRDRGHASPSTDMLIYFETERS
ncbi:MAG TPA: DinB family protein [Gemmatimonadaceae bacterium]|nr:DinB family protein [Gemmatimonadaceae bacterium]